MALSFYQILIPGSSLPSEAALLALPNWAAQKKEEAQWEEKEHEGVKKESAALVCPVGRALWAREIFHCFVVTVYKFDFLLRIASVGCSLPCGSDSARS